MKLIRHVTTAALLLTASPLAARADSGIIDNIHVGVLGNLGGNAGCVAFDLVNGKNSTRYAVGSNTAITAAQQLYQTAILALKGERVGLNPTGFNILCGTLLPTFTGLNSPPTPDQ